MSIGTPAIATADLARIRYVTTHYGGLQGLRLVPLGVVLLLATPLYAGWHFAQSGPLLALWLLPLVVGVGLQWLVGAYYTRTFGRVHPIHRTTRGWRASPLYWLVLLAALVLADHIRSPRLMLVVFCLLGMASAGLLLHRGGSLRLRVHWVVLTTLVAAVNVPLVILLPLLRSDPWTDYTLFALWVASASLCLIVGGLLDHRVLLRALRPLPEGGSVSAR
jgi:hypothetical protein